MSQSLPVALQLILRNPWDRFSVFIPEMGLTVQGLIRVASWKGLSLVILIPFSLLGHEEGSESNTGQDWGRAHASVDRFAVLYDMWTWEAALLENKRQVFFPRKQNIC